MVAAFKEYVFDFEELKLLSITCSNCNTETIVDLSKPSSKLPYRCTPCNVNFDAEFHIAITAFHSAYKTLKEKKEEIPLKARIRIQYELKASEF